MSIPSIPITVDSLSLGGSNTGSRFGFKFQQSLTLGNTQWEIGLVKCLYWITFPNISESFPNNTLRYSPDNGVTFKTLTIQKGRYSIEELNDRIHLLMKANGDFTSSPSGDIYGINLFADYSTQKSYVEISAGYQLDLTNNGASKLNLLLGFNNTLITINKFSESTADLNNGINNLKLVCSAVQGSYDNSSAGSILALLPIAAESGAQVNYEPINIIWTPVLPFKFLSEIQFTILDSLNREIDFLGEPTSLMIVLRPTMQKY